MVSLVALLIELFDVLVSIVSFGALSAFTVVNLSVIKHFLIDERRRGAGAVCLYGLVPLAGVAATAWLWLSLSRNALLAGLAWLAIGAGYLAMLRLRGGLAHAP